MERMERIEDLNVRISALRVLWARMLPSAPALRRSRRRNLARRLALDSLPKLLILPACAPAQPSLPQIVPALTATGFSQGRSAFPRRTPTSVGTRRLSSSLRNRVRRRWVVHVKPPFGGPRRVLKYLARYTHRVAISNHRLRSLENGRVSFDWKDYADHSRTKLLTLDAVEFLRRFLLHVLPTGLVRIRQFGFLANRIRRGKLALCRLLLAAPAPPASDPDSSQDAPSPAPPCPICQVGHLLLVELIHPGSILAPDTS